MQPTIQNLPALRLIGIEMRYAFGGIAAIPNQWQDFAQRIPTLAPVSAMTYGVMMEADEDGFAYLSAVECAPGFVTPPGLSELTLTPNRYAVFEHNQHVSTLSTTCDLIWSEGLHSAGLMAKPGPWFERYGSNFDPAAGLGEIEIWIPLA